MTGVQTCALPIYVRFDLRYTSFNSSFGSGTYESAGITRELSDHLRLQLQAGVQNIQSIYTSQTAARFVNSMIDYQLGRHYYLMGSWLYYRGQSQNYDQVSLSLGYRFGK